jgi:hypothetical protein
MVTVSVYCNSLLASLNSRPVAQIKSESMSFSLRDVRKPSGSTNVCFAFLIWAREKTALLIFILSQMIDIKVETEQEISRDIRSESFVWLWGVKRQLFLSLKHAKDADILKPTFLVHEWITLMVVHDTCGLNSSLVEWVAVDFFPMVAFKCKVHSWCLYVLVHGVNKQLLLIYIHNLSRNVGSVEISFPGCPESGDKLYPRWCSSFPLDAFHWGKEWCLIYQQYNHYSYQNIHAQIHKSRIVPPKIK